jgi:hypothetical protein
VKKRQFSNGQPGVYMRVLKKLVEGRRRGKGTSLENAPIGGESRTGKVQAGIEEHCIM